MSQFLLILFGCVFCSCAGVAEVSSGDRTLVRILKSGQTRLEITEIFLIQEQRELLRTTS
jgi:hypothetical protein